MSLRFEAEKLSFEDAQVTTQQSVTSESNGGLGGTFSSRSSTTLARSNVTVMGGRALQGGGCAAGGDVVLAANSSLHVVGTAAVEGGALFAAGSLRLRGQSTIFIEGATSSKNGGGLLAQGEVDVKERSLIQVRRTRASGSGGGFLAYGGVIVANARVDLDATDALRHGGGIASNKSVLITDSSTVRVRGARAGMRGGGIDALAGEVVVLHSSRVDVENATAEAHGGGIYTPFGLLVGDRSQLTIANSHSVKGAGGALAFDSLRVDGSVIRAQNVSAIKGGALAGKGKGVNVTNKSAVHILSAKAGSAGGGLWAERGEVLVAGRSSIVISESHTTGSGGGVYASKLVLDRAEVTIQATSARISGGGFFACGCSSTLADQDVVVVANSSKLMIADARVESSGGGFGARGRVVISESSEVTVLEGRAQLGGGFAAAGLHVSDASIRLARCSAMVSGGGFTAEGEVVNISGSSVTIESAMADQGAGFFAAWADVTIARSRLAVVKAQASFGAGFYVGRLRASGAEISIEQASATRQGGGVYARPLRNGVAQPESEAVVVTGRSKVYLRDVAAHEEGGGLAAIGKVMVAGRSVLTILNGHSLKSSGGGMLLQTTLELLDGSMLRLRNTSAAQNGGAISVYEDVRVLNSSSIVIRNATAGSGGGGGIHAPNGQTVASSRSRISVSDGLATWGGGLFTKSLQLHDATVSIRRCSAKGNAGGFHSAGGVQATQSSAIRIQNVTSGRRAAGFYSGGAVEVADGSEISVQNAVAAAQAGGFEAHGPVLVARDSRLFFRNCIATAGNGGGFMVQMTVMKIGVPVRVVANSSVRMDNVAAGNIGAGLYTEGDVSVLGSSNITIQNGVADSCGGIRAGGKLLVSNGSAVEVGNSTVKTSAGGLYASALAVTLQSRMSISQCVAVAGHSGGFWTGSLQVSQGSIIRVRETKALVDAGGFTARDGVEVASHSRVWISDSHALKGSGGGLLAAKLSLSESSTVVVQTASAGKNGGGVYVCGCLLGSSKVEDSEVMVITTRSSLSIQNAVATLSGGGLAASGTVVVSDKALLETRDSRAIKGDGGGCGLSSLLMTGDSSINIQNATAGYTGGGLHVGERLLVDASTLNVSGASAARAGGGIYVANATLRGDFAANLRNVAAGHDGGGFWARDALVLDGTMVISNATANGTAVAGRAQGQVRLEPGSQLLIRNAAGDPASSILAAGCMQLSPAAALLMEAVTGGHGLDLQNADCSICANQTLEVADGAFLNASGELSSLSSGFLSMATCLHERVRLSGIHLQSWSSPLLSTRADHVTVEDVHIDYAPPLREVLVLATEVGFTVDSLEASCPSCAQGVAFNASASELRALSTPGLTCPTTAAVANDTVLRCTCANYQTTLERFADHPVVALQDSLHTCSFCPPHMQFWNGTCRKCAVYNAWSDGRSDVCHLWPQDTTQFAVLLGATASCALLAFLFLQILYAPLVVVDAKSQRIQSKLRRAGGKDPDEMDRSFVISVQGPLVDLPKRLSQLLHRRVIYRAQGTGLEWLDYNLEKANAIKVCGVERSKVEVQGVRVPFDCASTVGSLHATEITPLFLLLCAALFLLVLLPVAIQVAIMSGNGLAHVLVTAGYCALPSLLVLAVLYPLMAWIIRQRYQRTPFTKALEEYRRQIQHEEHPGPDAAHPKNQGLLALTLWELWGHFQSFILLDRNMHFVVANIVRPLTRSQQVSFVSLWGGREVSYFVSHSWGTSFAHFARSIHCHALSAEGQLWMGASYWICSFANNQWDIEGELGSTIMESAFARTLRGGIKGVAMVLDHEVQPLTRVWCLFEFLLSKQLQLELVFATDVGVIGDDGCTSFDIALQLGDKIEFLQVANCHASSEEDRPLNPEP
ncbi:pmpB [Symbiodinium natans]|uniref:PmpB protein n=1 Tax=Symbiodinium natans TaxID=878477 RepID=A0A812URG7_9DINO|nr:pmpB [Symbiodinium natans]